MSEFINISGINILPRPPIKIGIIIKNIINIPWKVIIELYCKALSSTKPVQPNSSLINNERMKPIEPPTMPTIIYMQPIII